MGVSLVAGGVGNRQNGAVSEVGMELEGVGDGHADQITLYKGPLCVILQSGKDGGLDARQSPVPGEVDGQVLRTARLHDGGGIGPHDAVYGFPILGAVSCDGCFCRTAPAAEAQDLPGFPVGERFAAAQLIGKGLPHQRHDGVPLAVGDVHAAQDAGKLLSVLPIHGQKNVLIGLGIGAVQGLLGKGEDVVVLIPGEEGACVVVKNIQKVRCLLTTVGIQIVAPGEIREEGNCQGIVFPIVLVDQLGDTGGVQGQGKAVRHGLPLGLSDEIPLPFQHIAMGGTVGVKAGQQDLTVRRVALQPVLRLGYDLEEPAGVSLPVESKAHSFLRPGYGGGALLCRLQVKGE